MSNEEIEQASKAYRQYREECGVGSPTELDEIESAYYMGMKKMREQDDLLIKQTKVYYRLLGKSQMKEQMMKEAMPRTVKFLDSVSYNHCIAHLGMKDSDQVKIIIIKPETI